MRLGKERIGRGKDQSLVNTIFFFICMSVYDISRLTKMYFKQQQNNHINLYYFVNVELSL